MCNVSVVMASYNGEQFIEQQIASILKQLDDDSELIISDNNSTDRTVDIIQSFKSSKIKLFKCPEKNVIANFENGLKQASGEIIFLSDQDDIWLDNKVTIVQQYLIKYDLVMTDSIVVGENLQPVYNSFYALTNAGKGLFKNLYKNSYQGSNMAFKKKILDIALPFPGKIPMHDIWIGFVGELFYKTIFIKDALSLYRRHSNNASSSTVKSTYGFITKVRFRLQLLSKLPLLIKRKYTGG